MAEAHFNEIPTRNDLDGEANYTNIINGFGAVLSLGLVAAVVVWGYQLAVRDVAGVPVIRALDGPMRIQPADPGGVAADHQGLTVNAVQAGAELPMADQVMLATGPIEVTESDLSASEIAAEEAAIPSAEAEIANALSSVTGNAEIRTAADLAVAAALAQDLLDDNVTIESVVQVSAQTSADALDDLPAPLETVRPRMRPVEALAAGTSVDIDPATLPVGTRLVQLGAFDSEEAALGEWDRLAQNFEAYISDKRRIIQRTESSGRVFYRLRAQGFSGLSDARRFCAGILASESTCIPVQTR